MINNKIKNLIEAENKALQLFNEIENKGLICSKKTETELNKEIFDLAYELFGIKKYWHKRIVRVGKNTLLPYRENPENLTIKEDDILFFDFGPVFEDWEADVGRTYVIGNNPKKLKLKQDVELAWKEARDFYFNHSNLTGAQFYDYISTLAPKYGWEWAGPIGGHLIGNFPHDTIQGEEIENYIHPDNLKLMKDLDVNGLNREWILEIHFIDRKDEIGGFYEQFLV
jgi:methionine aminopeptidase